MPCWHIKPSIAFDRQQPRTTSHNPIKHQLSPSILSDLYPDTYGGEACICPSAAPSAGIAWTCPSAICVTVITVVEPVNTPACVCVSRPVIRSVPLENVEVPARASPFNVICGGVESRPAIVTLARGLVEG